MGEILDFQNLCRICLEKMENKRNMISIFQGILKPHLVSYKDMIEECACIQILTDNVLPQKICYTCSKWLKISYKLKIQCLVSEEIIKNEIKKAKTNSVTEENEKVPEDAGWWINLDDYDYNVPLNSEIEVVITDGNERKSEPTESSLIDTDKNVHNADFNCDYNLLLNSVVEEAITEGNTKIPESTESCLIDTDNNVHNADFNCDYNLPLNSKIEENANKSELTEFSLKNACNLYDERFKKRLELDIRSVTKIRECQKKYKETKALLKQSPVLKQALLKTVHQCTDCNRIFKTRNALKWHEDRHLGLQSLCPYCGKIVASSSLKNHLKRHSKEMRYCCEICGFKATYSLVDHLKTHTQEKKYECEICKKRFTTCHHLGSHKRRHKPYSERKYLCNICGKRFLDKTTLRNHNLIHTGERKHICYVCNKPFKTPDNLRQHLRSHSGIKRFACNQCGRGFSAKHVLNKHLTTHCKAPSLEL